MIVGSWAISATALRCSLARSIAASAGSENESAETAVRIVSIGEASIAFPSTIVVTARGSSRAPASCSLNASSSSPVGRSPSSSRYATSS